MALTRSMLKGMGLTEEQVGAIIDEHTNVTSALKDQIKEYKTEAEKLPSLQKELEELRTGDGNDWEDKYKQEHKAFEDYKTKIAEDNRIAEVKSAYKDLLKECNVGEKHIDSILRVTDFSDVKVTDGKLENADTLKESIKSDWSGFITDVEDKGAKVDNPPAGPNNMTKEAYEKLPLNEQMVYANAHPSEVAEFYK